MGAITHNGDVITGLPSTASQINYDNTSSGMAATQVQAAVDELKSGLNDRLPKGTIVGLDANTITGMGCWMTRNTTDNHMPGNDNNDYILCHIGNSELAMQICQIYHGTGQTSTYIRQHVNGWSQWQQFSLV